jgi:co-chaperonin GroES (HSP10)
MITSGTISTLLAQQEKEKNALLTQPPTKPLGHYVLVKLIPVQFKSTGGIVLMSESVIKKEEGAGDVAEILAFGPICYKGFANCESPEDWGVKVGDIVELSGRYDGKKSRLADYDNQHKSLRYVVDDDIVGVLSKEIVKQLINEDK